MFGTCTETVSILYAMIFGTDGACIEFTTTSILTAFGAFMLLVVIAQFFARRLWTRLTRPSVKIEDDFDVPTTTTPYRDDPKFRDSAIRSSKR